MKISESRKFFQKLDRSVLLGKPSKIKYYFFIALWCKHCVNITFSVNFENVFLFYSIKHPPLARMFKTSLLAIPVLRIGFPHNGSEGSRSLAQPCPRTPREAAGWGTRTSTGRNIRAVALQAPNQRWRFASLQTKMNAQFLQCVHNRSCGYPTPVIPPSLGRRTAPKPLKSSKYDFSKPVSVWP